MFGPLGGPELILILVIALIVFGPRKLPEIGKGIGRMMGEFRRASNDFRRTIEDEVESEQRRDVPQIGAAGAAGTGTPILPAESAPPAAPGDPAPSLDPPAGTDLPPGTEGSAELPPLAPPEAPTFARAAGAAPPPWERDETKESS